MKKITTILCLLLLFSLCLFAEPKIIGTSTEIPPELTGTWFSLSYSEDQGKTQDYKYEPIFNVTTDSIVSSDFTDKIISVEKFRLDKSTGYILHSEDKETIYVVVFYPDTGNLPLVYIVQNKKEQCRILVNIVKDYNGGEYENH